MRFGVFGVRERQANREDSIGAEAGVDRAQTTEALHDEQRGDDEHERERNFAADEKFLEHLRSAAGDGAGRTERAFETDRRHPYRGIETEQQKRRARSDARNENDVGARTRSPRDRFDGAEIAVEACQVPNPE